MSTAPAPSNGERLNRLSDRLHELERWRWETATPAVKVVEELVPIVRQIHEEQIVIRDREQRGDRDRSRRWSTRHTVAAVVAAGGGVALLILQVIQTATGG